MTREKAKGNLIHAIRWNDMPSKEALDMAIKALEQEPCEDAISRADAINKVTNFYTNCERLKMFRHTSNEVKQTVTDILCDLPPVQPKITNKSEKSTGSNDCIDRAQAQTELEMNACRYTLAKEHDCMGQVEWSDQLIKVSDAVDIIRHLSSVTPQEQKTGQWILLDECSNSGYYCSECHKKVVKEGWSDTVKKIKFCPNCGAKMVEPQETETWNGYHGQITAPKGTFERIFNDADDENDI